MQVAGDRRVLTLYIDFTPSLALYIWQSFRKGLWQAVQHPDDVLDLWMLAADISSTQGCIAISIANSSGFLPSLLIVDPLQTFKVDRLLYQNHDDSPEQFILPKVSSLSRSLLLFAQLLAVVAAQRSSILAQDQELRRCVIASKLQELTDVSCCTPIEPTDPFTPDQTGALQPLLKPSKHIALLRSAVLITKLAALTNHVKADVFGHVDPEMPKSVQALWRIMSYLATSILESSLESTGADSSPESANQEKEVEREELCAALCEHLVVTLRQSLKEPQAGMQRTARLSLLTVILTVMSPAVLGYMVKKLGKGCFVKPAEH